MTFGLATTPRVVKALILTLVSALLVFVLNPIIINQVKAAPLDNRSVTLSDNLVSVTTNHLFQFDIATAGNVGSLEFEYCTNDPFPGTFCFAPTGLDVSSVTIDGQTGETGFSVHGNTTANRIVLTRAVSAAVPGTVSYDLGNLVNPDTSGSYYIRIATFATTDGTGARTDDGGLAFAILDSGLDVEAYVPPILIFCLGGSISAMNCASATTPVVDFGTLTKNQTRTGTTEMVAGTNGVGGYAISVVGTTMTSGNHVIPALSAQGSASAGNARFGLNLVNNSNPNVGSSPIGAGTGVVTNDYDDVNLFKFSSGDVVATSPLSTHLNKFTTSYIVDVDPDQHVGVYTTTMTYICLATF